MTKKELNAKIGVLAKNSIVSYAFLHAIGLENDWNMGNGKKVECYRNYYLDRGIPKSIQDYIDKGYMRCAHKGSQDDYFCFKVTDKGFEWLSELLGIKVEEQD